MKPLKLTMSAFGSYGKETVIDFTKVDHGLFLITGDTGSGKTTIFDGITFAIFGETSGGKRDGKMMRSQFASPSDETYVELTFSYRGEVYTVRRSPEYMREKKRGTGLMKAAAAVELTMPDGTAFRGKVKDTDKKLCEIMGIDREQFTQIAMIAQGEFLRLLHAKSEERKKIFSTIFHTGLYRKVEEELGEHRKELKEKIGAAGERVKAYVQGMEEPETMEELLNQIPKPFAEDVLADVDRIKWDECLANTGKKLEKVKIDESPDVNTVREILEQFLLVDEAQLHMITGPLEQVDRGYGERLERRGLAKSSNDVLDAYEKALERFSERQAESNVWNEQKAQLERAARAYHVKLFFDKWKQAEQRRTAAESDLKECEYRFDEAYGRLMSVAGSLKLPDGRFENGRVTVNQQVGEVRTQMVTGWISEWKAEERMLESAEQKKRELDKKAVQLERFEAECKKKAGVLENMMAQLTKARERYGILQDRFFLEQAGILAKERLVSGSPCPVCGSLHHPAPAVLSENAVMEADVREAQSIWENKRAECERLSLELHGARAQLEEANVQLELARKEIPDRIKERRFEIHEAIKTAEHYLVVKEKLEKAKEERNRCRQMAEDAKAEYSDSRQAAGFADEGDYLAAVSLWCSKEQVEIEQAKNQRYFSELQELQTAVQTLNAQTEGKVYTDLASLDLELEQWKYAKDSLQSLREQAVRARKNHESLLETLNTEEKSYRVLLEEFLLYDGLWQTAGGKIKGQVRLDFETYVQRMYFEKILAAANKRFLVFTDGRLKLKSRPMDEMGLVGASGLEINVYVMATGKERDVKTLSGGESFLASLALALGLSDVIQSQAGSIRLESMFVDEGFGALDDATREQAMRVLHDLAGDHRLVGIISHVNTLKDSIERKLVVKRTAQGSTIAWSDRDLD